MPLRNSIEYLGGGRSIEDLLSGFPRMGRERVVAFPEEAVRRRTIGMSGLNVLLVEGGEGLGRRLT